MADEPLRLPLRATSRPLIQVLDEEPSKTVETESDRCSVCKEHAARYTCPHCQVRYCRATCFANHNTDCSEGFYRRQVEQVQTLEQKAQRSATQKLLQRVHDDHTQLAQFLDDSEALEAYLQSHPEVWEDIQQSIRQGDVQDWIVEPWYPWWRPNVNNDETVLFPLDDRLASIPLLSELTSKSPSPYLIYHILDHLFAIATVLHVYQGIDNAHEHEARIVVALDPPPDALAPVLLHYSRQPEWPTVSLDVLIWLRTPRYVYRVLLEAQRLCGKRQRRKLAFLVAYLRDNPTLLESLADEVDAWKTEWSL